MSITQRLRELDSDNDGMIPVHLAVKVAREMEKEKEQLEKDVVELSTKFAQAQSDLISIGMFYPDKKTPPDTMDSLFMLKSYKDSPPTPIRLGARILAHGELHRLEKMDWDKVVGYDDIHIGWELKLHMRKV